MQSSKSLTQILRKILSHIDPKFRKSFFLLLVLTFFTSLSEAFSLGILLPFLGVLINPELFFKNSLLQPIIRIFELTSAAELVLPITISFIVIVLIVGVMRLALLWGTNRLSYVVGLDLSKKIYRRTLYQPYYVHCSRNSSEVIDGILTKTNEVMNTINNILILINSFVMLNMILIITLIINPFVALISFGSFGLIYFFISLLSTKKLLRNSEITALEATRVIKTLQEGLGGIRDILINNSQEAYCEVFNKVDGPYRRAQSNSRIIANSPRFATEALAITFISLLAFFLIKKIGIEALPILGVLALGAQRLLPLFQQAYSAWSNIKSNQIALEYSLKLLDQPLPKKINQAVYKAFLFKKNIKLQGISFRYNLHTPYIFENINVNISKGSRVGLIGTTGGGKSTLLDIIMGLLNPTDGSLSVDGKIINASNLEAWQAHIAHVPQTIFLLDASIAENIALGIPKDQVDQQLIRLAAQQAQILDDIQSWPKQFQTIIGEGGIRLSGGQRQRIGIARALYKQADVIVFDEATSALDNKTEQAVIRSIESLGSDITIFIIAHRLSTLKSCSQILELNDGVIKYIGNYDDMLNKTFIQSSNKKHSR